MAAPTRKSSMHERNVHRDGYDMARLMEKYAALKPFVLPSPAGTLTIDFSDVQAVTALNKAILESEYGVNDWNLPEGYLCPPVPGRADYMHHAADLLALHNGGTIPTGHSVHVLDIGVGAGVIYPILGNHLYQWSFVGSDIDEVALSNASVICKANERLQEDVQLRAQKNAGHFFKGIIGKEEVFDLVVCNPPFYGSEQEAQEASGRKWRNLGKKETTGRNFGGMSHELYCEGGELKFIRDMVAESFFFARKVYWFTTLVSRQEHIHDLRRALNRVRPTEVHVIPMSQGQKSSRILAWTFLDRGQQQHWRESRFWSE
jgi:23S rRNA (adenine1618-N6)-methyltransferase